MHYFRNRDKDESPKLENLKLMASRLEQIDKHDALFLLRQCFAIPKVMYFFRTGPCFMKPEIMFGKCDIKRIYETRLKEL